MLTQREKEMKRMSEKENDCNPSVDAAWKITISCFHSELNVADVIGN